MSLDAIQRLHAHELRWKPKSLRMMTSASLKGKRPLATGCGLLTQYMQARQAPLVDRLEVVGKSLEFTGDSTCTLDARLAAADTSSGTKALRVSSCPLAM